MTTYAGTRPQRLRRAALCAAAVIGVTACSGAPSTGGSSQRQGAGGGSKANMANMPNMANMAATPGVAAGNGAGATAAPGLPQKGDTQVRIVNFTFSPATITVRAGQTVEWTNRDAIAHTVDFSGVISNVLNRGGTYTQRFTAPGTYRYICSIHPFMHGTVVVTK